MIEAFILWGVLSGNADRWEMYKAQNSDEEDARDTFLVFILIFATLLWPITLAVHLVRLAFFLRSIPKLWLIGFLGLVPLIIGGVLLTSQNYLVYGLVGLAVCIFEMMRIAVRAIEV